MTIATGTEMYSADSSSVKACGLLYTDAELNAAICGPVSSIIWDDSGAALIRTILIGLSTTEFSEASIRRVLSKTCVPENWRVGEGLAEVFLTQHRACEFPCPSSRDSKNPKASLPGTDLVGFQHISATNDTHRFAFGEVKTSEENRYPPTVMTGRHNLINQIEILRDSAEAKDVLMEYLCYHSNGATWISHFKSATKRYLANPNDVSLFGVLIRDVEPNKNDLESRAELLSRDCPSETSIELCAIYIPKNSICTLSKRIMQARGRAA